MNGADISRGRRRGGAVSLAAAAVVAAAGMVSCGERAGRGGVEVAPAGGSAPVPVAAPTVDAPAEAVTAEAEAWAVVPGSERRKFIAPLQDAYERMDPEKDGWETEAFNTAAMEQLLALKRLLTGTEPVTAERLAPMVGAGLVATRLRPDGAAVVFDDGAFKVSRSSVVEEAVAGVDRLAASLNELRSLMPGLQPQLKVVRVTPLDDDLTDTVVVVEMSGQGADERRQINGSWHCRWRRVAGGLPVVVELRVAEWEEVIQRGGSPLFADATTAVMAGNRSFGEQLLVSTDHWRARLPRDLGLDPVANHGLAVGDVNGDDLDDLYLCQQGGLPNRLFLQNADGTLRDATAESGADWLDYCAAALLIDCDNDGDRDLVVSQDFRILVMSNDGAGRFTLEFGASTRAQSFSLAAADYDGDGLVDFYVCGYNPSAADLRGGAMGEPMPFHDANNGGRNMLWRNEGGFKFTDVTGAVGLEENNTRHSFAAAWEDYDNDGDQDLYVANDYGRNCLYRNEGGKFSDVAAEMGVEDTSSGMSVSWTDFNRDGFMDLYTSNMFSSAGNRITYQPQFKAGVPEQVRAQFQHIALGNSLFQAVPGGAFRDVSVAAGVTLGRWAWSSKFVDFNNDGLEDILVANGFITTEDSGDL